jgi:two-component SAPR family response regulator
MLDSLQTELELAGYQVTACADGAAALEMARRHNFDLFISDIRMPGLGGLECLSAIREIQPALRTILITGYADQRAPITAVRMKVDDYLLKPFTTEEFLRSVRLALQASLHDLLRQRSACRLREALLQAALADPEAHRRVLGRALQLARRLGLSMARTQSVQLLAAVAEVELALWEDIPELADLVPLQAASLEKWDGSGPQGLKGVRIPLEARILAAAREAEGSDPTLLEMVQGTLPKVSPLPAPASVGVEIRVYLLGPLRLEVGGTSLEEEHFATRKTCSLFAYLMTRRGTTVFEESLMGIFWPQANDSKARHSLHNGISLIRRLLKPLLGERLEQLIVKRRSGYQIAGDSWCWVDLEEFQERLRQGRGGPDAATTLLAAESLYRGEFLQGLADEWVEQPRLAVQNQLLSLWVGLAQQHRLSGDPEASLPFWHKVLAMDNCHEEAYLGLMLSLWELKRTSEAVKIYHQCVARLREEIQVAPPPRVVEAYLRITAGEPPRS